MRMSRLFTTTLREAPAGVDLPSQRLLLRAGYAHMLSAGVLAALPLGKQAAARLEILARDALGLKAAREIELPIVLPNELAGPGASPLRDLAGRALALGGDGNQALAELIRAHIRSHRQLPAVLAQSAPAWRDDLHPRDGWLHSRSGRQLHAYHLLPSETALEKEFGTLSTRLAYLFERCMLNALPVEAGTDADGKDRAVHWFYAFAPGADTILHCPACGYSAEIDAARFQREPSLDDAMLPLEKVATPHCPTIDSLARFLNIPATRTAKAVFLMADFSGAREPELLFAVLRGDRDLSETKLRRLTGARGLRPATDAEIAAVGAVPGYASPVGLENAWVIVDTEIPMTPNLVSGANEQGYHLRNVNYPRDYRARQVADIAAARPGQGCQCGAQLESISGVFVAHLERRAALDGCTYWDENRVEQPIALLSLRLDLYRLLACMAEEHNDERGLSWPSAETAPFDLHLTLLGSKTGQPESEAERLYEKLHAAGYLVLFDDRVESPGVKFNDADLIGQPLRLTVSERSLKNGGVELKLRAGGDAAVIAMDQVLAAVREVLGR
jgi:prolyl-tRNA synthetase